MPFFLKCFSFSYDVEDKLLAGQMIKIKKKNSKYTEKIYNNNDINFFSKFLEKLSHGKMYATCEACLAD